VFVVASSHTSSVSNCEYDLPMYCNGTGWGAEPPCCGTSCTGTGSCRDIVWSGITRINLSGGRYQGCSQISANTVTGVMCCLGTATTSKYCGDGVCDSGENSSNCPNDCVDNCGNGVCDSSENNVSCSSDCGPVVDDVYGCTDPGADNYNPAATVSDQDCQYGEDNMPCLGVTCGDCEICDENKSGGPGCVRDVGACGEEDDGDNDACSQDSDCDLCHFCNAGEGLEGLAALCMWDFEECPFGCGDPNATNYDPDAPIDPEQDQGFYCDYDMPCQDIVCGECEICDENKAGGPGCVLDVEAGCGEDGGSSGDGCVQDSDCDPCHICNGDSYEVTDGLCVWDEFNVECQEDGGGGWWDWLGI